MDEMVKIDDIKAAVRALCWRHGLSAVIDALRNRYAYVPGVEAGLGDAYDAAEREAQEMRGRR